MSELTTTQPKPRKAARYKAAIDNLFGEMDRLNVQIEQEQARIQRLKAERAPFPPKPRSSNRGWMRDWMRWKRWFSPMWEKMWDYAKRVALLTRQTETNTKDIAEVREDVKDVRQELKELNQKVDRLAELCQRMAFEFQRDRENAASERENQRLRLENILLRSERRLLPGDLEADGEKETLREFNEALQRENEALRKRLEQLEAERQ